MVRPTLVVYRRWIDDGEVFAIFPTQPGDHHGMHCMTFDDGQFRASSYDGCMMNSHPVLVDNPDVVHLHTQLEEHLNLVPVQFALMQDHIARRKLATKRVHQSQGRGVQA